jgi:hypothetical protein
VLPRSLRPRTALPCATPRPHRCRTPETQTGSDCSETQSVQEGRPTVTLTLSLPAWFGCSPGLLDNIDSEQSGLIQS